MLIFAGRNRITSGFRLPDRPDHSGLDIVGDDSRDIPLSGGRGGEILRHHHRPVKPHLGMGQLRPGGMTPTETGCISATWRAGP